MSERKAQTWSEVDKRRRGGQDDKAPLPARLESLVFELAPPRVAASLFDRVLPVASSSLLAPTSALETCCVLRDTTARASVSVVGALLCVRSSGEQEGSVEIAGLAVSAAYRGCHAASNLFSFAVGEGVLRPGDTLTVHVQADNTDALCFYARALAMAPREQETGEQEPPPKRPRVTERDAAKEQIKVLSSRAAKALGTSTAEELTRCCVANYYPRPPACRFGTRHAFVLETHVPKDSDTARVLPWSSRFVGAVK